MGLGRTYVGVLCTSVTDRLIDAAWSIVSCPDPALSWGKRVWWLLSSFLVVLTQQYWFEGMLITCLHNVIPISLVYAHAWILFHWIVQNQVCWLSTTKKLLNSHQTLFLVRGRGLGMRLLDKQRLRGGTTGSKGHKWNDHVPTRGAAKLHLRRLKTEFYRRSFEYMGAKLYNELPGNRL